MGAPDAGCPPLGSEGPSELELRPSDGPSPLVGVPPAEAQSKGVETLQTLRSPLIFADLKGEKHEGRRS